MRIQRNQHPVETSRHSGAADGYHAHGWTHMQSGTGEAAQARGMGSGVNSVCTLKALLR